MGLSWWTTYVLTPFRLDGLALGGFLAVTARQLGLDRLARAVPPVVALAGGLLAFTFAWTRLVSREELAGGPAHPGGADPDAAGLLASVGPNRARAVGHLTLLPQPRHGLPRHLQLRPVRLSSLHLGYLTTNRTEFALAHWLGSHGAAVALQATVGASISLALAYLSYEPSRSGSLG